MKRRKVVYIGGKALRRWNGVEEKGWMMVKILYKGMVAVGLVLWLCGSVCADGGDLWKITFYCECEVCCGKGVSDPAYGIMASGRRVYNGAVACNVLPLGTEVWIEGWGVCTVEDRGAHRLFDNQKHIDVYIPDHEEARVLGVEWREVLVFND